MALILEHTGDNKGALDKWKQLRTDEGCLKTVSILRKSSINNKTTIFEYLEWVLEKKPEIGLRLFIERGTAPKASMQKAGEKDKSSETFGTAATTIQTTSS